MQGKVIKQHTFGKGPAAPHLQRATTNALFPALSKRMASQMHLTARQGNVLTGSLLSNSDRTLGLAVRL